MGEKSRHFEQQTLGHFALGQEVVFKDKAYIIKGFMPGNLVLLEEKGAIKLGKKEALTKMEGAMAKLSDLEKENLLPAQEIVELTAADEIVEEPNIFIEQNVESKKMEWEINEIVSVSNEGNIDKGWKIAYISPEGVAKVIKETSKVPRITKIKWVKLEQLIK